MHYFLNIGSNLGNRKLNISRALRMLEEKFRYFDASHIVESRPWGYVSDNSYLNIAVRIVSDLDPEDMLKELHEIEDKLNQHPHRDETGQYADREIDIDIMAVDYLKVNTPELTIPHKHLAERRFFLEPMAEIAPFWTHPITHLTCEQMLAALPKDPAPTAQKHDA